MVLILLGTIIIAIATVMLYDARKIATKTFSSGEINETTKILKIVGFILLIIGLIMVYVQFGTIWGRRKNCTKYKIVYIINKKYFRTEEMSLWGEYSF